MLRNEGRGLKSCDKGKRGLKSQFFELRYKRTALNLVLPILSYNVIVKVSSEFMLHMKIFATLWCEIQPPIYWCNFIYTVNHVKSAKLAIKKTNNRSIYSPLRHSKCFKQKYLSLNLFKNIGPKIFILFAEITTRSSISIPLFRIHF